MKMHLKFNNVSHRTYTEHKRAKQHRTTPNNTEQHRTCVKQLTCEACIHVINTY
jgi:hypothetical protein